VSVKQGASLRHLRPLVALLGLLLSCDDEAVTVPIAPTVIISTPSTGASLLEGATLQLSGTAADPQDGDLPDSALTWTSSLDGALGTGSSVEVASPSVGVHTITLTAVDSDGNRGSASVSAVIRELDFLDGTVSDPEIALVVASLGNALRLVQLGDSHDYRDIPLGASSTVTATGISVRGEQAVVPLGNAASVASINLRTRQVEGFYLFPSGNATGSVFVDHQTVLVTNQETDQVGKFTLGQTDPAITETASVTPFPNDVVSVSSSLALVVSANLDDFYAPAGEGVVTAIDPRTMAVVDTVHTGGTNPQFGALGPDGLLYVPNSGNYMDPSSVAVIDPQTMTRVGLIRGFGAGSGAVHVDEEGLVYVSGFFFGTMVWSPASQSFVRGPDDPVCAPHEGGGCRGAAAAYTSADGTLYQTFFGSPAQGLSPWVFQYSPGDFQLVDSIPAGMGPVEVEVHTFRSGG
jgi:hypothetical protein